MSGIVRLFPIPKAGEVLGKSRDTVYRMIAAGEIQAVKITRGSRSTMRIREDELQRYVDSLEVA